MPASYEKSSSIRVDRPGALWLAGRETRWSVEVAPSATRPSTFWHVIATGPVSGPLTGQSAELLELRQRVRELETRLEAHLSTAPGSAGCCRNIDRAKAKEEVLDYFARHAERGSADPVYPSDCAAELNLDVLLVTELCDELETEGLLQ